jgi:hypothetical protein
MMCVNYINSCELYQMGIIKRSVSRVSYHVVAFRFVSYHGWSSGRTNISCRISCRAQNTYDRDLIPMVAEHAILLPPSGTNPCLA